jgi:hypothetical protein
MVNKPKQTVKEDLEKQISKATNIEIKSLLQAKLNLIKSNEIINK